MIIIYLIVIAFIFLVTITAFKEPVYSPMVIFLFIWFLVPFLSSLRLFEIHKVSDNAVVIMLIGSVFFILGCWVRRDRIIRIRQFPQKNRKYKLNYNLMIVLYMIVLVFTAYLASKSIGLLMKGTSLKYIRHYFNNLEEGIIIDSSASYLFETYVVQMFEFAAVALLPIVISDRRGIKKTVFTIELLTFLVLHLFVTGSRSFVMHIVVLFLFYFFMMKGSAKAAKDYLKKIPIFIYVLAGSGAVFLVIYTTILRKGDISLFREFYRYLSIPCPLLDIHIDMLKSSGGFTNGWTTIYGFIRPPVSFLHMLGVPFPPGFRNTINQFAINNNFIQVGGGKANSYVTLFYYMYMDFGILGMIPQIFIYGYFCYAIYDHFIKTPNIRNQAIYLLVLDGLFFSFSRHAFTSYRYTWAFLVLFIAFSREKNEGKIAYEE